MRDFRDTIFKHVFEDRAYFQRQDRNHHKTAFLNQYIQSPKFATALGETWNSNDRFMIGLLGASDRLVGFLKNKYYFLQNRIL